MVEVGTFQDFFYGGKGEGARKGNRTTRVKGKGKVKRVGTGNICSMDIGNGQDFGGDLSKNSKGYGLGGGKVKYSSDSEMAI